VLDQVGLLSALVSFSPQRSWLGRRPSTWDAIVEFVEWTRFRANGSVLRPGCSSVCSRESHGIYMPLTEPPKTIRSSNDCVAGFNDGKASQPALGLC
jgi:hypothetical protein